MSTRLGSRHKSENITQDKEDQTLYWIGENGKEDKNGPGTDFHAIKNNYVSITPLKVDLTSTEELTLVSDWIEGMV